mgnify:CR=1 FL=1
MVKNSFSILETIISLSILSIIIAGFLKLSFDTKSDEKFQELNSVENSFTTNDYKSFDLSLQEVTLIENDSIKQTINVRKYQYNSSNMKIYKYEYEK